MWPFKDDKPKPPKKAKAPRKRSTLADFAGATPAQRMSAHARMLMHISTNADEAKATALALVMLDGLASLAGWRITISGIGDRWKVLATTDDGRELEQEASGILEAVVRFVNAHGRAPIVEAVERIAEID